MKAIPLIEAEGIFEAQAVPDDRGRWHVVIQSKRKDEADAQATAEDFNLAGFIGFTRDK